MATTTLIQLVQRTQHNRRSSKSAFASVTEHITSKSTTTDSTKFTERLSTHKSLLVNQDYHNELSEVARPHLGPHGLLLRTKATGLNPIEWKTVEYKFCMSSLPWINGRECARVIEAVGTAVEGLRVGK